MEEEEKRSLASHKAIGFGWLCRQMEYVLFSCLGARGPGQNHFPRSGIPCMGLKPARAWGKAKTSMEDYITIISECSVLFLFCPCESAVEMSSLTSAMT